MTVLGDPTPKIVELENTGSLPCVDFSTGLPVDPGAVFWVSEYTFHMVYAGNPNVKKLGGLAPADTEVAEGSGSDPGPDTVRKPSVAGETEGDTDVSDKMSTLGLALAAKDESAVRAELKLLGERTPRSKKGLFAKAARLVSGSQ